MTQLMLIRHGETDWNREKIFRGRLDVPLSDRGEKQAELTGSALAQEGITRICSSPLKRAVQTAEAISRATGVPVQLIDGLTDIDYGEWAGLREHEAADKHSVAFATWQTAPEETDIPGGEKLAAVFARARASVEHLLLEGGGNVAVVTHRVVLKLIVLGLLGLGPEGLWPVKLDTCSLTRFQCRDSRRTLTLLNDTNHLGSMREADAPDF